MTRKHTKRTSADKPLKPSTAIPPDSAPLFVSLRDLERQVLSEGQKWMEERFKQELQALADRHGEVSPPQPSSDKKEATPTDHPPDKRGKRRS
jgi:hypothetical protein